MSVVLVARLRWLAKQLVKNQAASDAFMEAGRCIEQLEAEVRALRRRADTLATTQEWNGTPAQGVDMVASVSPAPQVHAEPPKEPLCHE